MKMLNFVVCDDIRNEMGGKHSIMGVYGNSIEFAVTPEKKDQWPKTMRTGFFITIQPEDSDREKNLKYFSLKMDYNGKVEEIAQGGINFKDIPPSRIVNLAILHNNFSFKEPGKIKFSLDFSDAKKDVVGTLAPDYILKIMERINQ